MAWSRSNNGGGQMKRQSSVFHVNRTLERCTGRTKCSVPYTGC